MKVNVSVDQRRMALVALWLCAVAVIAPVWFRYFLAGLVTLLIAALTAASRRVGHGLSWGCLVASAAFLAMAAHQGF